MINIYGEREGVTESGIESLCSPEHMTLPVPLRFTLAS